MFRRVEERLVLVLAVQIDQRADALLERPDGGHLPAQGALAPPVGADTPAHNQLLTLRTKASLDQRLIRARAH